MTSRSKETCLSEYLKTPCGTLIGAMERAAAVVDNTGRSWSAHTGDAMAMECQSAGAFKAPDGLAREARRPAFPRFSIMIVLQCALLYCDTSSCTTEGTDSQLRSASITNNSRHHCSRGHRNESNHTRAS